MTTLERLAQSIVRRPKTVIALAFALAALALGVIVSQLKLKTSRGDLIDSHLKFRRDILELEAEHGDQDFIVAIIQCPKAERAEAYSEAFVKRLRQYPKLYRTVFSKVSAADFGDKAWQLLPPSVIENLSQSLGAVNESKGPRCATAETLEIINASLKKLAKGGQGQAEGLGAKQGFEFFQAYLNALSKCLEGESINAPWMPRIPKLMAEKPRYTWSGDGKYLVVLISPCERQPHFDPRKPAVKTARAVIKELRAEFPDVEAGLTGKPVLNVDEMKSYTRDSQRAGVLSLVGVTLLLILSMRRLLAPLAIGFCLVLSIVYTLGMTALWPGHLNLLSSVFMVVIIGLGVDFGLHLILRFDEENQSHEDQERAFARAMKHTGVATSAGALTTSLAFFTTVFTDFKGVRELGVIAGFAVLCALLVMLTVFPALLLLLSRWSWGRPVPKDPKDLKKQNPAPMLKYERSLASGRFVILALGLGFALFGAFQLDKMPFDRNLIKLQDPQLKSVQLEFRLMEDKTLTGWFLVRSFKSPEKLKSAARQFEALASVRRVDSLLLMQPKVLNKTLRGLNDLAKEAQKWRSKEGHVWHQTRVLAALTALAESVGEALDKALRSGRGEAANSLDELQTLLFELEDKLKEDVKQKGSQSSVTDFEAQSYQGLSQYVGDFSKLGGMDAITERDWPQSVRDRFIGKTGRHLLRIYPKADIWNDGAVSAFIDDCLRLDDKVTGTPLVVRESSRLMVRSYKLAALYSFIVITLFLVLFFRRLDAVLLCMTCMIVAALWFAGLMALTRLQFNPANLIALPLFLGVGVDYAVHVLHRYDEWLDSDSGQPWLSSSLSSAVLTSALTSVIGFGSLVIGHHRGIQSIGLAISFGILCSVLASLTFLPAMLMSLKPEAMRHLLCSEASSSL